MQRNAVGTAYAYYTMVNGKMVPVVTKRGSNGKGNRNWPMVSLCKAEQCYRVVVKLVVCINKDRTSRPGSLWNYDYSSSRQVLYLA